jgi:hypothetical protein
VRNLLNGVAGNPLMGGQPPMAGMEGMEDDPMKMFYVLLVSPISALACVPGDRQKGLDDTYSSIPIRIR